MAKSVAWKIDLLMKLTGTSNSELGRRLGYDASYISRIRHGKRGLPPEQPFIEPASALFAKLVSDDYQRRILAEELGRPWPENAAKGQKLIAAWLEGEQSSAIGIRGVVDALGARLQPAPKTAMPRARSGHGAETRLYFGNSGKRDAVIAFLSALCETGVRHTLLLHSDEDMTWLYEDDAFARQWAGLLGQLAANGSTIRIIHAISRDANEMWEAVRKWMPLYMTGAVEPYYYPHLRDGVYRRTLFIAPGHSAIAATSVHQGGDRGLNALVRDRKAVAALEGEFGDYFSLCRPLMQTRFPAGPAEMGELVARFAEPGEGMLAMLEGGKLVCAREDGRALAANVESPLVAFIIEEPRMASAVWEYLRNPPAGSSAEGESAQALLADVAEACRRESPAS